MSVQQYDQNGAPIVAAIAPSGVALNAPMIGRAATLVAGDVTVSDPLITADSLVLFTRTAGTGTPGVISVSITPGVSVKFTSTQGTDNGRITFWTAY